MLEVWLALLGVFLIAQTWLFSVLVKGLSAQIDTGSSEVREELAQIIDQMLEKIEQGTGDDGISPVLKYILRNVGNQDQMEPREIEPKPR